MKNTMISKSRNRLPAAAACIVAFACVAGCGSQDRGRPTTSTTPQRTLVALAPDSRIDDIEQRHFAAYTDYLASADHARAADRDDRPDYSACAADM